MKGQVEEPNTPFTPVIDVYTFESPESSNIEGASYDPLAQQLTVRFKGDAKRPERPGRVYRSTSTSPVTMAQWLMWMEAPSKGAFFAAEIKPVIEFERVS